MMGKTILVIPDQHAHPDHPNDRALWLGKFMYEIKPDIVVNMGDGPDMPSLSSYDKGKRSFHGRSYAKDIQAHTDFQEKLWHPYRASKKRLPKSYVLLGNHEWRIEKALDLSPELEETLTLKDLEYDFFYDEVIPYDGSLPGMVEVQGITFAHYLASGILGKPISGENPAAALLAKQHASCVVGHSHLADYAIRTVANGGRLQAVVAGVYQDYEADWCGKQVQKLWWPGVVVLHAAEGGCFDPQFISLNRLKAAYVGG